MSWLRGTEKLKRRRRRRRTALYKWQGRVQDGNGRELARDRWSSAYTILLLFYEEPIAPVGSPEGPGGRP